MSEEDYRMYVKLALDSQKELMALEFESVKTSQRELYRASQEQVTHIYEVIKMISKNLDDFIERAEKNISTLRDNIQSDAISLGRAREEIAKALSDTLGERAVNDSERFQRLEAAQSKMLGACALAIVMIPIVTVAITYFANRH